MSITFTKMHGIGNDYVYINGFEQTVDDPVGLSRAIADRHTGVGGDGLILILPPANGADADVRMRMFNADGSESEMCGNGIRCVCKYAHDHGLSTANPMRVDTGAGVLTLEYTVNGSGHVEAVTVDMGEPRWHADEIPVRVERIPDLLGQLVQSDAEQYLFDLRSPVTREGHRSQSGSVGVKWLSMGNPHIVFFCRALQRLPLERVGPLIEFHDAFPNRINAHFVEVRSRDEVTMRSWERGSGITRACGTGAAAVCVAGVLAGRTDRELLVHLPGGDLQLRWDEPTNHVFMIGPAVEVFTGVWSS